MVVKSAPGTQCPTERNPREYITDSDPVEVPDTSYYRRLLDDGSLIEAVLVEAAPAPVEKKSKGGDQ